MRDKWVVILSISIVMLLILTFYFFYPLIDGIVMGIVFSYVAKPVKNRLRHKTGRIVSSLIATLVIILPISFLMFYGAFQGINQLIYLLAHQEEYGRNLTKTLIDAGIEEKYVSELQNMISTGLSMIQDRLRLSAIDVTVKTVLFLINFIISSVVCYYVLLDGENFVERLMKVFPEDRRSEFRNFVLEIDETFHGLWFGNFVFAIVIGIASIPFFMAFGIPFVPLLSGLMFLAALIPIFAEWMVLAPVALYLALKNIWMAGWFISLGFVFLYFIPELLLRPHFVGYTSKIHPLILMLAFIGGAIVGGVAGFFIAPMVAGLMTAVYNYYTK
ncbi:MAG TPA: AI-2E family transporter [Archaeoglobaceae archaeon]|nr:AI-2E family transporter [Archaeoglobaceae archaeon]